MSSADLATRYLGCAAVWIYAENEATLKRMPPARLVDVLLAVPYRVGAPDSITEAFVTLLERLEVRAR